MFSKGLPVGEESIIEVGLTEIPTSKREEEVTQDNNGEIPEDQLGDEENCGATSCVEIIPDETINEADTKSISNTRVTNANLDEDALPDTSNPEDMLTDDGISRKEEAAEEGHLVEDEIVAATKLRDLPVGKELVIGIDLNKIPTSKREEEIKQEEAVEIPENQPSYKEECGTTGRVVTLDDTDTEFIGSYIDEDVITSVIGKAYKKQVWLWLRLKRKNHFNYTKS